MRGCSLFLLALIAGCTSSGSKDQADAAIDSTTDAPVDAASGLVRVRALNYDSTPRSGAPIVFGRPDGSVLSTVMTDADGRAEAIVEPGGSATLVSMVGPDQEFYTVLDIAPGDDLILGDHQASDESNPGSFTVSYTATPNATYYVLWSSCGMVRSSTTTMVTPFSDLCLRPTMDLVVVAYDVNDAKLSYVEKSVVFVANGSTVMPATWLPLPDVVVTYTNASGVTDLSSFWSVPGLQGHYAQTSLLPTTGGTVVTHHRVPTSAGAFNIIYLARDPVTTFPQRFQYVRRSITGSALTHTVDVGSLLLPWLGESTWDPSTATATIGAVSGTGAYDLFRASLTFRHAGDPIFRSWVVLGPSATTFTLPQLPASLAEAYPRAGDSPASFSTTILESNLVADYKAARADPSAFARTTLTTGGVLRESQ